MGQQARVNQNLAHAKLAQHEDVFDYTLQQLKRINGNCDALLVAHEALVADVAAIKAERPTRTECQDALIVLMDAVEVQFPPTGRWARLRWLLGF